MRSTAAPHTESRLARLVRNKRVGFPVVEQGLDPVPGTPIAIMMYKLSVRIFFSHFSYKSLDYVKNIYLFDVC